MSNLFNANEYAPVDEQTFLFYHVQEEWELTVPLEEVPEEAQQPTEEPLLEYFPPSLHSSQELGPIEPVHTNRPDYVPGRNIHDALVEERANAGFLEPGTQDFFPYHLALIAHRVERPALVPMIRMS